MVVKKGCNNSLSVHGMFADQGLAGRGLELLAEYRVKELLLSLVEILLNLRDRNIGCVKELGELVESGKGFKLTEPVIKLDILFECRVD